MLGKSLTAFESKLMIFGNVLYCMYKRYGCWSGFSIISIRHGLYRSCRCSCPLLNAKYIPVMKKIVLSSDDGEWSPKVPLVHSVSSSDVIISACPLRLVPSRSFSFHHPMFCENWQILCLRIVVNNTLSSRAKPVNCAYEFVVPYVLYLTEGVILSGSYSDQISNVNLNYDNPVFHWDLKSSHI